MSVKIKVFLYAHINHIGAFNLSARYLAKYLDPSSFKVFTLSLAKGQLDILRQKNIQVFNCFYPAKISNYLGILWGIYHADVVFVMRGNHFKFVRFCLWLFRKPSFKRQGNQIDDAVVNSVSAAVGGKQYLKESFNFCTKVFAPTHYVGEYNLKRWGIPYDTNIFLPPFIDTKGFTRTDRERTCVKKIIFIGNDMIRKNIDFYCLLAKALPEIQFLVVGKPPSSTLFKEKCSELNLKNLVDHGLLAPDELNDLLDQVDLHCLTSKSEGFGKVTIEVAAKGIPSVLFDHYGAYEWLKHKKEGIIVHDDNEYIEAVRKLVTEPSAYQELVENLSDLNERFSIEKQAQVYEKIIKDLHAS